MNRKYSELNHWDQRFLMLAKHISGWSKDPSTKTGAVITLGRRIISTGFNGFPQGMDDSPALYADREVKYSKVVHCEVNALIFAERSLKGCTLYTWPFCSCDRCCTTMLQAGIGTFVFPSCPPDKMDRWGKAFELTKRYVDEAGRSWVEVEEVPEQEAV